MSYGTGYAFAQTRYEYHNNFADVDVRQAKVIADAEKKRQKVWDMLTDQTFSTRSRLSKQCGVDR